MMFDVMKKERENKELTQKEISNILGISRSTYAGWENGFDTVSLPRLIELCDYLGISLDYMCGISNIQKHKENMNAITDSKIIGKNLKSIRLKFGHTQSKTAKLIHTTQSNYSRYERGINTMPTSLITAFSKIYNVSIDYLCGKKKDSKIV